MRGHRHPALFLALLVVLGICAADQSTATMGFWLAITLIAVTAVIALLLAQKLRLALILAGAALVFALGGWRMAVELHRRPSPSLVDLIEAGEPVEVFGRLSGIPRQRPSGWSVPLDVHAAHTSTGIVPVQGGVLLSTRASLAELRHGDEIRLTGRFEAPFVRRNPGGFDFAAHLFHQGIDAVLRPVDSLIEIRDAVPVSSFMNTVEPFRVWVRNVFTVHLPKPSRALILGFLLGDTDQLSSRVMAAFRDSGTLHLLAVSGANVWLLVGLVAWPMRLLRIPRWPRSILLVLAVAAFCVLTRNEPSVVRASLMVSLFILGRLIYRPMSLLNAVGASAFLILLASPFQIFRPGFQLSYAAVIGIAVVGQRTAAWTQKLKNYWVRAGSLIAVASVAATLATAPIVAWHFGTVSLVSILANLAMIPLAGVSLYFCLALALLSVFSVAVASWIAYPAVALLDLSASMASLFARMPGAHLAWPNPSPTWIIHFYVAGVLALNWKHRYRWLRPATWYAAGLLMILLANMAMRSEPPVIRLAYLDAGHTRVAACGHPNGSLVWLTDDPGIDERLEEWVTRPFVRASIGTVTHEVTQSWRRWDPSDASNTPSRTLEQHGSAPGWRRYVSTLDSTSEAMRIWCDRFAWGGDTIFCLRDYPTSPPGAAWLDTTLGTGQTVILPARTPDRLIRTLLDSHRPQRVAFCGRSSYWRDPDQYLELWRMRYPDIAFYSTSVNGCLEVLLGSEGSIICPTVTE